MAKALICCLVAVFFGIAYGEDGIGRGTLRFVQNDQTSSSFSAGIVQVYVDGTWGGICSNNDFGQTEANVICHQFGYSAAASYSTVGNLDRYGSIDVITISNAQCFNNDYQVLFQCNFIHSNETECDVENAVIVECMSTRVWDDPFSGQIRLQRGEFSSEGLVEIYCNDRWGTVCDDLFTQNSADTVCNQLGYTNAIDITSEIQGNTSQPIWLTNTNCGSVYSCLTSCASCPSSDEQVLTCSHQEDVNVHCAYESTSSQFGGTLTTCDFTDLAEAIAQLIAIIVGVVIAFFVIVAICIILPICICCCLGVGIGAAAAAKA